MDVRRLALLTLTLAFIGMLLPGAALAHGGHSGPMQTYTQMVGPYDLAITLELPPTEPATLYLDVMPESPIGQTTLTFRAAPRGQPFSGPATASVQTLAGAPSIYYTQLDVSAPGDWDLEVRAHGAEGDGFAIIPFTLYNTPLPGYSIALYGALGTLVLLMVISLTLTGPGSRSSWKAPRWAGWIIGQGMFACVIVAIIFGVQQVNASIQNAQNPQYGDPSQLAPLGLPHANVTLHTDPALPQAGQPLTLTLDLSDGGTGLPVEDIEPHHEALIHLVVINDDGSFFTHTHPAYSGPGQFVIAVTPDRPGHYTAYSEVERQNSGIEIIPRSFTVGGTAIANSPPPTQGTGTRYVAGMQVTVSSSLESLQAGQQTTLTFNFASGGTPVRDMQPWLGMAGHMIARNDDSTIYGHIHAAEIVPPTTSPIVENGVRYGPSIRFVYTFPQPGHYLLWGQFKHNDQIVTVPVSLQVAPASPSTLASAAS